MAFVIRLVLLVLVIAVVVWAVRRIFARPQIKCATCRHCGQLFDDGSICVYGTRETFKNMVHIKNCVDYEKR